MKKQSQSKLKKPKMSQSQKQKVKELRLKVKEINKLLQTETIDQAEMIVSMLAVEIDRIFNDRRLKVKVSELEIKAEEVKAKKLVDLVSDLSITEATGILYKFDEQIKHTLRQENTKRKLKNLKMELL